MYFFKCNTYGYYLRTLDAVRKSVKDSDCVVRPKICNKVWLSFCCAKSSAVAISQFWNVLLVPYSRPNFASTRQHICLKLIKLYCVESCFITLVHSASFGATTLLFQTGSR